MSFPICVIEDNNPIRRLFCTLLKKNGLETVDFSNGTDAIEWLKNNQPELMIIDILLPDMNGSDILQFARALPWGNEVPMVAATGFAQPNDKEKFIEMGFDSYIPKPINIAEFVGDIKAIIESKQK